MKKIALLLLTSVFVFNFTLAGNVTGKVNFKGTAPKPQKIKMNADAKCVKLHDKKEVLSDAIVINTNSTLKNVFIYVSKGLEGKKFPPSKETVKLNQEGCMYTPHVLGVMVNQPVEIINSDNTLHNVHSLSKNSPQFNVAQPKQGMKMTKTFTASEQMVKVKCEVHNWMSTYVGVMDHPFFAVSNEQGSFTLKNLPAGDYEITAWQEKLGTAVMKVKVSDKDATADFTFEGK